MATLSPILVSSSPSHSFIATTPPHRPLPIVSMSSSPGLPSPSRLFAREPGFLLGSRRGPGPISPIAGFTSASNLLPSAHTPDHDGEGFNKTREELGEITDLQNRNGKAVKSKKLSTDIGHSAVNGFEKGNVQSKTPSKSCNNTAAIDERIDLSHKAIPPKAKNPEKRRTKKSKGEKQTIIKKSKITKPISISARKMKSAASTKNFESVKVLATNASAKKPEEIVYPRGEEPLDLGLVEAIRRRKVWTPIKDTEQDVSNLDDNGKISCALPHPKEYTNEELSTSRFEDLLGDYRYANNEDSTIFDLDKSRDLRDEALTKRRKLELVMTGYPSAPPAQTKKLKLPRKKPQTITEKATAPFVPDESGSPSLLDYFSTPVDEANEEIRGEIQVSTISSGGSLQQKPNTKVKKKKVTSKVKTKAAQAAVLVSPKTAIKSAENQKLVFGTSSQLVRDESPSYIEDMRQSTEASRLMDEQGTSTLPSEVAVINFSSNISGGGGVTPFMSSRNLWSVAARDSNGSLLNIEFVDLVDTPKPSKIRPSLLRPTTQADTSNPGLFSTDELQLVTEPSRPRLNLSIQLNPPTDSIVEPSIPRSLAEASLRKRPRSQSPVKKRNAPKDSGTKSLEPAPGQMPNYQGFTAAQLSKAVAANGFKVIKKRADMVALLERCWNSRNRMASQGLPPSVSLLVPSADGTKAETSKDGSPSDEKVISRKASTETIGGDAEPENKTSPKKHRGRPKKNTSITASSKKGPIITEALSTNPLTTHAQTQFKAAPTPSADPIRKTSTTLLSSITRAITTFPPTHSATRLTFNEKILLYEPIVLEDITAWLNTEGLGRVDVDEEVSTGLVKEWCMAKGVCFISKREGWRAKRG